MTDTRFAKLIVRNNTAAECAAENRVLEDGEEQVEFDTGRRKIGPGAWNSLMYQDELPGNRVGDAFDAATAASAAAAAATIASFGKAPVANYLDYARTPRRGFGTANIGGLNTIDSAETVALLANEGVNLVRKGIGAFASADGVDYSLGSDSFSAADALAALDANIASYLAIGAEFVLTCTFQTKISGAYQNDNVDPATWSGAKAAPRQASMQRFWQFLANRYKGVAGIIFSYFNEPHDPSRVSQVGSDAIVDVQAAGIAAIQAIDPARVCTVTGLATGGLYAYQFMKPIPAKNVLYEVHDYTPYDVTHSRAPGAGPAYNGGYPTTPQNSAFVFSFKPSKIAFDKAAMAADLAVFTGFLKRYGVVGFVGEFSCGPNPYPVAALMIRDKVALYEEAGLSYSFHDYQPDSTSPWHAGRSPSSTSGVETSAGTVAYNTITGATSQTGNLTPLLYLRQAFEKNVLFGGARALPDVQFEEDFETGITGRPWTSNNRADNGSGGAGATITWATALASPAAGATTTAGQPAAAGDYYALLKHVTGSVGRAQFLLADSGAPGTGILFDREWRFRQDTPLVGGGRFTMLNVDNGGSAFLALNSVGTSNFGFVIYRGTGSGDDTNNYYLIDGMSLPTGVWRRLRVRVRNHASHGEVAVWQDGVLLDVIQVPTIIGTNNPWQSAIGYYGTQNGYQCGVDMLRQSRGASLI